MTIYLLANQGEIGGGEVMLRNIARALHEDGINVHVVAPAKPSELADSIAGEGISVTRIAASGRVGFMVGLRRWAQRHRKGAVFWCNGLLPAVALAGMPHRIVHLHQEPQGRHGLLAALARRRAVATVVPSAFIATRIRGSHVLGNWVTPAAENDSSEHHGPVKILGFLGRLTRDKGILVLLDALKRLNSENGGRYRLLVGGEPRFVSDEEAAVVSQALDNAGDAVEILGWTDTYDFLTRVDALICPSVWEEPFGLVAAEAMAARVPVVICDSGALPEVVGHEHPFIARRGDATDLAQVITSLDDRDLTAVVEQSYDRWEALWSPDAGRTRVLDLLTELDVIAEASQ